MFSNVNVVWILQLYFLDKESLSGASVCDPDYELSEQEYLRCCGYLTRSVLVCECVCVKACSSV